MKIGVSSQNFREITGHAGKGRRFIVFSPDESGMPKEIERLDLPKEMALHEFRGEAHPLFDLDVIITASCGQGFANRLMSKGVKVIATSEKDMLKAVSAAMRDELLPPPEPHDHEQDHDHGLEHHHPFLLRMGGQGHAH